MGDHLKNTVSRGQGYNQTASLGGHAIEVSTQEDAAGKLISLAITLPKEGSFARGLISGIASSVSIGLEHGVPLEAYVDEFTFSKFEPAGIVSGNPSIKNATSMLDYVFRELAITYLQRDDLAHVANSSVRNRSEEDPVSAGLSSMKEREKIALSCVFMSRSLETYLSETAHRKPNDEGSLDDWNEMRVEIEYLIGQLNELRSMLLVAESSERHSIDEKKQRLFDRVGVFFTRHSDAMDTSVKMSLAAGFVGLFNLMGATMAVATPVVLAVFGGATVVSLLKGSSSELPK